MYLSGSDVGLGVLGRFKQGVRSQLVWRHGTLLSSGVVKRVSGLQAIEFGTRASFQNTKRGIRTPFVL